MAASKTKLELEGFKEFSKMLRKLGAPEAPFLRKAWEVVGRRFVREAAGRARGRIGQSIEFRGIAGRRASLKARVRANHPGSSSQEFGRVFYYRGFTRAGRGRGQQKRTGTQFRSSPGQRAKPYMGIKAGGSAIASVGPFAKAELGRAMAKEFKGATT